MIRRIAGVTPYELIKEVRWQYIYARLGEEKIRTATEAASMIGMSNASDFSKQFEQRFGHPLADMLDKTHK
jgi:methylphosphotriester-DNA--protein-cysteine methyltransferase